MERFRDTGTTIYSFQDEFLVQCPNCHSRATIRPISSEKVDCFAPRRFSCQACGISKDRSEREITRSWHGEAVDNYFYYSLWLQAPCCGQTLWAYNLRHLAFIEGFVAAKLREQKPQPFYGWSNRSLFSRLPKWMQSRKNREAILKAIAKIRQKT